MQRHLFQSHIQGQIRNTVYSSYGTDCSHNLQTVPDEDGGTADQDLPDLHEISTMNENDSSALYSFLYKMTISLGSAFFSSKESLSLLLLPAIGNSITGIFSVSRTQRL
jgi:hypothetical protein